MRAELISVACSPRDLRSFGDHRFSYTFRCSCFVAHTTLLNFSVGKINLQI